MPTIDLYRMLLDVIAHPRADDRPAVERAVATLSERINKPHLATEPHDALVSAMEAVMRVAEGKPCLWAMDVAQRRARAVLHHCRMLAHA